MHFMSFYVILCHEESFYSKMLNMMLKCLIPDTWFLIIGEERNWPPVEVLHRFNLSSRICLIFLYKILLKIFKFLLLKQFWTITKLWIKLSTLAFKFRNCPLILRHWFFTFEFQMTINFSLIQFRDISK